MIGSAGPRRSSSRPVEYPLSAFTGLFRGFAAIDAAVLHAFGTGWIILRLSRRRRDIAADCDRIGRGSNGSSRIVGNARWRRHHARIGGNGPGGLTRIGISRWCGRHCRRRRGCRWRGRGRWHGRCSRFGGRGWRGRGRIGRCRGIGWRGWRRHRITGRLAAGAGHILRDGHAAKSSQSQHRNAGQHDGSHRDHPFLCS